MPEYIHESRSKIFKRYVAVDTSGPDVNTKYRQQKTSNLNSLAVFKRGKNYVFNLIKLLFAALAPTVAPYWRKTYY